MHESLSDTPISSTQRVQLPPQLRTVHGSTNLGGNHGEDAYARLLMHNACYESMPSSNKMVVFDLGLVLRKAFNGLIYQNTRHVLVSDARQEGKMQGILSVTDFIRVMLRKFRERKRVEHALAANEEHDEEEDIGALTIEQYRDLITAEGKQLNLITVNADQSLLEAARLLSEHHIHRLPVLDPEEGSPLYILTHKRILKFLWCFGQQLSQPEYHIRTAKELGVGAWQGIRVVFPDTPLVDCLDILLHKGVSGLPVVERNTYRVVDMYSRFDAIGIALEERANSLDVTVQEALEFKNTMRAGDRSSDVVSVRDTDTLWRAITMLVEHNVHRVCAVDAKGAIEGVISLSDVINFLVVKPGAALTPPPPRHWREKKPVGDMSDHELKALLLVSYVMAVSYDNNRESIIAAHRDKIDAFRLPIKKYVKITQGPGVIPFPNMMRIFREVVDSGGDWKTALHNNISKRHLEPADPVKQALRASNRANEQREKDDIVSAIIDAYGEHP